MKNSARICARLIEESRFIVAFTGAGISTNAGMPDFRGPTGIYTIRKYGSEEIFEVGYFLQDPKPFYNFARDLIRILDRIRPTFTHHFLAKLEKKGKLKGIITQNIDTLHQKAGSKNVLELHGNMGKSFCLRCRRKFSYEETKKKILMEEVARCSCGGLIKPDITFFGEMVKHLDKAQNLVLQSDLLFVIGSSLTVYPAAMIPRMTEGKIVVVNKGDVNAFLPKIELFIREDIDNFFKKVAVFLDI